jgi:hypothetical protein
LIALRDILGTPARASLEMHSEAVIEQVWTWTWRRRMSLLREAGGGHDRSRLEEDVEAIDH